jgi:hypothetical protein
MSGDQHRALSVGDMHGVPVFWDERSGDAITTVERLFRVGLHDERLPSTGLTALVASSARHAASNANASVAISDRGSGCDPSPRGGGARIIGCSAGEAPRRGR